MSSNFIHLHVHSEYSIHDGMIKVKQLVAQCVANKMQAVALTDQNNLYALVKFYKAAINSGVKPIIGSEINIIDTQENTSKAILLCQNKIGYRNLTELISESYISGQKKGIPYIQIDKLKSSKFSEGLIIIADFKSIDTFNKIKTRVLDLKDTFLDRFYLSVSRINADKEQEYNDQMLALAKEFQLPMVASNYVCFLHEIDYEAHETRVCIGSGEQLNDPNRKSIYTSEQYFKSSYQMQQLFADLPSAIINTYEIAKRCNFKLELGKVFLPNYPIPKGYSTDSYFAHVAKQGLEKRLVELYPETTNRQNNREKYFSRLDLELEVINNMGFAGYFLIVADFIEWSFANDIPVGPGRGSGAGSLVAYSLNITGLDPLEYDLLFERFLNPERVSMPDFDIDFCMDGRDRVIEYVANKYGKDAVSQIITYGTMAARAVIKDVGRALGHPYIFVDLLAKLIPMELGITLDKALDQEDQLKEKYKNEDDVRDLFDLAKKLEGIARNVGRHAGGVVIAPSKLTDFAPLYCEENDGFIVTQLDKNDVEEIGLVKFDFLGLRTLTIIDWTLKSINAQNIKNNKPILDLTKIPLNDLKTYELLCAANTTAVFQLESRGMKDLIKKLHPDCFEDIIALVALFRPGPLQSGMVDDFINRKLGKAEIAYPYPSLENILKPTYGIILYQEQVMQIAQLLAGYSLGSADLLRRAMGKKKPEEMAKQREVFITGAVKNNINSELASSIFDLMEKFAAYGFNKSHSAAYALLSYQTAWLKTHYPSYFMAAVLSADLSNTDKIVVFIDDCENCKIKVLPPDVNYGQYKFVVKQNGDIIYGLGAIKGIGESAVESFIESRNKLGKFTDLYNFCQRIDKSKLNKRLLEALIRSGAMDSFGMHRAQLLASIESAINSANQKEKNKQSGQLDLFGSILSAEDISTDKKLLNIPDLTEIERLLGEKQTLGLYLTGHPINQYKKELHHIVSCVLASVTGNTGSKIKLTIAGIIVNMRSLLTKKGDRMAFVSIDDKTARHEIVIFSDLYKEKRDIIKKDKLLIFEVEISPDEYSGGYKSRAIKIYTLEEVRATRISSLKLFLQESENTNDAINQLKNHLIKFVGGDCPIYVEYIADKDKANIKLGGKWNVTPSDALLNALQSIQDFELEVCY